MPCTQLTASCTPHIVSTDMLTRRHHAPLPLSVCYCRYYLDQQKQDPLSSQPQQPSALSLADIEQFQTFFNNVNGTGGSSVTKPLSPLASTSSLSPAISSSFSPAYSAHQQQQPLFPFAEATALPPSAFSSTQIAQGSDLPIDPSLFSSILGPNNAVAQQPAAQASPVASTSKATKRASSVARKRAVSEMSNDISDEDEEEDDDDDLEEMEVDVKPATKAARKASTIKKASAASKKAAAAQQQQQHPHALVPVPEWEDRPSKEVYDKLSSKEKRQMRNKISARNFRHRRKAHIDTLEAEISQKDGIITHLREEVGTLRVGTYFLRNRARRV